MALQKEEEEAAAAGGIEDQNICGAYMNVFADGVFYRQRQQRGEKYKDSNVKGIDLRSVWCD